MSRATASRPHGPSPSDVATVAEPTLAPATPAPSSAVLPPVRPFLERFFSVLQVFTHGRGQQSLRALSINGFDAGGLNLLPDPRGLQPRTLDLLAQDDVELRVQITTHHSDRAPLDLPAAVALWKFETEFTEADEPGPAGPQKWWRHRVPEAAVHQVLERLDAFPLSPNFLLDGQHELVALWRLDVPLRVDGDEAPAVQLLQDLARRLGSDLAFTENLKSTVPIGGAIRNVGKTPPLARVEIIEVEPTAVYSVEQLRTALADPIGPGKKEARR